MKRFTALKFVAIAATGALALTACGSSSGDADASQGSTEIESAKVGIIQYVSHPSLDAVVEGFKKGIDDAGYGDKISYDENNAQGDQATNTAIAGKLASDSDIKLVLAIATPSAQVAAQSITNIPVLFSAVTDPVDAKLVASNEAPGGNVTGTSDLNPVKEQLALLKELSPDATKVGIVYSSGEANSAVQVKLAEDAAATMGLTIEKAAISAPSEVQQAADSLDVDAYYVPTDNAVVSALEGLLQAAETKKVPVIAADGDSVERGATATYGINYEKLGEQTAAMAVKLLSGEAEAATLPVETIDQVDLYLNETAAKKIGIEFTEDMKSKAVKTF